MADQSMPPENVSEFIDHLLKTKDPATVGLRRILKRKSEEGRAFPLREVSFEEFPDESRKNALFTDNEKETLLLQKRCVELQKTLIEQKKKANAAVQHSYQKGLAAGLERGVKEGEENAARAYAQNLAAVEERFAALFETVEKSKAAMLSEHQTLILEMAQRIARKVISTELSTNSDIILSVVRKALSYVADREKLIVRVAPDDLETITNKRDFWLSVGERLENIRIEADERIDKGGCIIESASGAADARITVQLDELREIIDRVWRDSAEATSLPPSQEARE